MSGTLNYGRHPAAMMSVVVVCLLSIVTIIILWLFSRFVRNRYERGELKSSLWWLKIVYLGKVPDLNTNPDEVFLVVDQENKDEEDETNC